MTLPRSKYKYKTCFYRAVYDSNIKAKQLIIKGIKYSTTIYSLHYLESKFQSYPLNSTSQVRRLLPNKPIQRFIYHHGVNTKRSDIPYLKEVLKKTLCKRLMYLDFLLTDSCLVKDKDLRFICSALKQCLSLKYLNLTLQNLYSVTGSGFVNLRSTFGRLISLNNLKLQFAVCNKVNEKGKEYLLKSFKGFHGHQLESIYLNIGRIYSDLSEFLPRFINIISDIDALKSLGLNLLSNDIEEENFIESCQNLCKIPSLQAFKLATMRTLCPTEIEALIKALGQLKELRSVYLKLKQFECEHYGSLSESLTQLENLQELKLYFYQEKKNYESHRLSNESWNNQGLLRILGPFFESHSKSLKILHLQFFISSNIDSLSIEHLTSEGLVDFSQQLSACTEIQYLHLFLPYRYDVKSLSCLFESISRLGNLKILFLFIAGGSKDDLKTLPFLLSEALVNNPKLEKISLFFRNFRHFGEEGLQELAQTLPKLPNLRKFTFELSDCEPIKKSSLIRLLNVLKNSHKIKKAELGLTGPEKQRNLSIKELSFSNKWKSIKVYESALPYALSKTCSFDLL